MREREREKRTHIFILYHHGVVFGAVVVAMKYRRFMDQQYQPLFNKVPRCIRFVVVDIVRIFNLLSLEHRNGNINVCNRYNNQYGCVMLNTHSHSRTLNTYSSCGRRRWSQINRERPMKEWKQYKKDE